MDTTSSRHASTRCVNETAEKNSAGFAFFHKAKLDKWKRLWEIKLILLGAKKSGKSTFLKQMRMIYGQNYTVEDRVECIKVIRSNIICAMQTMIKECLALGIELRDPESLTAAELVQAVHTVGCSQRLTDAIRHLWDDPDIQQVHNRKREYHLSDNTHYYMDNLTRIFGADYLPTNEDILQAYAATPATVEYVFETRNNDKDHFSQDVSFRIVEIGGQHIGQGNWWHCLRGVTSFLFMAALSDYDQQPASEPTANRMQQSMALFQRILQNPCLQYSSTALFLTKNDIFEQKIMTSHLVDYFPDYTGRKQDSKAARDFIARKYSSKAKMYVHTHFVTATDTGNVRAVFAMYAQEAFLD